MLLSQEVARLEEALERLQSSVLYTENKELRAKIVSLSESLRERDLEIKQLKLNVAELGLTLGRFYSGDAK